MINLNRTIRFLFLFIVSVPCLVCQGQFNLNKLTDKIQIPDDIVKDGLNKFGEKLDKSRKDYEEKTFNYAISLSDNAGLFENEEKFAKNKNFLLSVAQAGNDEKPLEKASALNSTAEMLYASNKYKQAENLFKKSANIYTTNSAENEAGYALVISNLGLLYLTTGRFIVAEEYTLKGLELRKNKFGELNAVYGASVNNLGVLYKDMGRYQESERLLNQAIDINIKTIGKQSVAYAITLNNKAVLLQTIGRYDEALDLMNEAVAISEKELGSKSINFIKLKTNIAMLYKDMARYTDAESIFKDCMDKKEKKLGTNHPDYAHLLGNLAALYQIMGKNNEVESLLKRSSNIYKKQFGEEHPAYATACEKLGNFYVSQKKYSLAEPLLNNCLDVRRKTLGENHPEFINANEDLAILNWQIGKIDEAKTLFDFVIEKNLKFAFDFFPSLSENEKGKLWDRIRPKVLKFYAFAASQNTDDLNGKMYNLHIATKGILLSTSTKIKDAILKSGNKELIAQYLNWLDKKADLSKLYTYSKEELAAEKINLDSLEKVTNDQEKALSLKSDVFKSGVKMEITTFNNIASALAETEAAIEIVNYKKFNGILTDSSQFAIMLLSKSRPFPSMVVLKNGLDLEKKFYNYYKNAIKNKLEDKVSFSKYWQKADSLIGNKKRVYLSLDGIYNQISINGLKDINGKYILDKYDIYITSNTKYISNIKQGETKKLQSKVASLIGFPNYGTLGTVAPLPGTLIEVNNLNSLLLSSGFKTTTYLKNDANEAKIKNLVSPSILHIATHGFFLQDADQNEDGKTLGIESDKAKENPLLRSGLMLAGAEATIKGIDTKEVKSADNGILTAFEAMNLNLDKTELVVLSACETGLGDIKGGEGVYGLQRAFQVAGANSLIMSLWKVDDAASQLLMTLFYKNWLKTNNKYQSFIAAQKELKLKYKEPYFWSAFILVGE